MDEVEVLIVGAGPTGLALALLLTRLGVRIRIIDKTAEPGTTSRALVFHARNLEFYEQIGLAKTVIAESIKFTAVNLWARGNHAGRVAFGDMGQGLSAFPYALIYPQDEHERMLIAALGRSGITVERPKELVTFEQAEGRVRAQLKTADGRVETCVAEYLAGCDGAHSLVREKLGTGFPGGTYSGVFYVADIVGSGPPLNGELHVALDAAELVAIFPMKGAGNVRLVGNVGQQPWTGELRWEDVSKRVIDWLRLDVKEVRWFSTYRVHHRVASEFRRGQVFLLGDAAHIHSPVGGQGMNTGIGDAVNLAWKLAGVLRQRLAPTVLDSYEPERMAFACRLVNSTDRAFQFTSSDGPIARLVRLRIVPWLLPRLFQFRAAKQFMFRTLSQTAIQYRNSSLSEGGAGTIKAGDRLPWVEPAEGHGDRTDNYASLKSLDWQVHCYGEPSPELRGVCNNRALTLYSFAWTDAMAKAGFTRNAAYLIRPDGYVALADAAARPAALERFLDRNRIQSMAPPQTNLRREKWQRNNAGPELYFRQTGIDQETGRRGSPRQTPTLFTGSK